MELFLKGDGIMKLPYDAEFKGEKISVGELVQMGIDLKQFVENYRKYILIKTPNKENCDPVAILNTLDMISHKMITQQYQDLFDNTSIIDTDDDSCPF